MRAARSGWSAAGRAAGLGLTIFLTACGGGAQAPVQDEEAALVERARGIHERVITLDTHADIPFDFATPAVDPGVRGDRQVDLPKMREGGLDVAFFIVYVGQTARTPANYQAAKDGAMQKFEAIHRMTRDMYPEQIGLACSPDEVERIHAEGRLVATIGIENGYVIGQDLSLIRTYYDLCARYFGLVHNGHNDIADSAQPRADLGDVRQEHGGLSAFGEEVVGELNRLGIMVDISHASKETMLQAVRLSRAPIIASHSGAAAVNPHVRNLDDEQLTAMRENGGVVQAVALDSFVKTPAPEKTAAIAALREELGITGPGGLQALSPERREEYDRRLAAIHEEWPRANVADFVDHIDHIARLIGIDHVGISSDFDGGGGIEGWDDASETFNVTLELVRRGYTEEEIAKIWNGNLLRVWREVERVAGQIQTETS